MWPTGLRVGTASDTAVAKGIHCGDAVKVAASVTGGGGGGRANQANGGGRDPGRLSEGLGAARTAFLESLQGS